MTGTTEHSAARARWLRPGDDRELSGAYARRLTTRRAWRGRAAGHRPGNKPSPTRHTGAGRNADRPDWRPPPARTTRRAGAGAASAGATRRHIRNGTDRPGWRPPDRRSPNGSAQDRTAGNRTRARRRRRWEPAQFRRPNRPVPPTTRQI